MISNFFGRVSPKKLIAFCQSRAGPICIPSAQKGRCQRSILRKAICRRPLRIRRNCSNKMTRLGLYHADTLLQLHVYHFGFATPNRPINKCKKKFTAKICFNKNNIDYIHITRWRRIECVIAYFPEINRY